ncbi:glycoside hydrolase [Phlegmacium glaucopus]|nr:glycoside hydrolase [Phlegmacium glaucopus]
MSNTKNITFNAPHFGAWTNRYVENCIPAPPESELNGLNFFNLCFWLSDRGPFDQALNWQGLPPDLQKIFKAQLANQGVLLAVTAFGSTDKPTTNGCDPIELADKIAAWVKNDYVKAVAGVDINYEDFDAFNSGKAEEWLIKFTKQLRSQLPAGEYIITHCPIAPWFRNDGFYPGGGYMKIHQEVGHLIDWYNVQFFSQRQEYETIETLLYKSSSVFPETSLFEIVKKGVPGSKLVIGKPTSPADAPSGGYMEPDLLAKALEEAKNKGWDGGVVAWQCPSAAGVQISQWMKAVRARSWPVPY